MQSIQSKRLFSRRALPASMLAALLASTSLQAREAVDTQLQVRAVTSEQRLIGSEVGGARVVVRDAASQRILAEGRIEGTGDQGGTAQFTATLALDEAEPVDVTVIGPLGHAQATSQVTQRLTMVPGKRVAELDLTLLGLVVEPLEVPREVPANTGFELSAKISDLAGGKLGENSSAVVIISSTGSLTREFQLRPNEAGDAHVAKVGRLPAGQFVLEFLAHDDSGHNVGSAKRRLNVIAADNSDG